MITCLILEIWLMDKSVGLFLFQTIPISNSIYWIITHLQLSREFLDFWEGRNYNTQQQELAFHFWRRVQDQLPRRGPSLQIYNEQSVVKMSLKFWNEAFYFLAFLISYIPSLTPFTDAMQAVVLQSHQWAPHISWFSSNSLRTLAIAISRMKTDCCFDLSHSTQKRNQPQRL